MKKLFFTGLLAVSMFASQAQVKTPQASPAAKVDQVVGLADIVIEYSRPGAKGRTVYGDLVPYGKNWRTGANANTIFTVDQDIKVSGKALKKGKYALYTTPKADSWDVIFYSSTDNWGLPENWDETKVALRVSVKPETLMRSVESFTISINNITNDAATLDLEWERTLISVPFTVPTNEVAMASIEKALAGPSYADYFSAAQYFYQSNNDMNKALTWVNKAIELTPSDRETPFWYLRLKSLIQAKTGDKKGAITTAKASLEGAKKAGNADYEKMNKDSIAEWSK